jgi:glycosyltransferase involved in cell wall biosynthesis
MSQRPPRVSIGLPVYNGEAYLSTAIDAILEQTFRDFELIICDNASTDRTEEICLDYARRDSRVRYHKNDNNLGAARNFNRTFELSRGEYFKWAAHDDLIAPNFLMRCVAALDQDPAAVLAYPWTSLMDGAGSDIGDYIYNGAYRADGAQPHKRLTDIVIPPQWCFQVFGLIRAQELRGTPLIGNYISSDKVLLAHLALRGRFIELPERLFFSRKHAKQSMELLVRPLQYMDWYDPNHQGKITVPHWIEYLAYYNAVNTTPMPLLERARCYVVLVDHLRHARRLRYMARDFVIAGALVMRRSVIGRLFQKKMVV